jgi:DNA-directed RNA polymerase specialized sigma24 family protein
MTIDPEPVTEALKRAQKGDADAFGVVVSARQARLRSFIAGYVPKAEWVDDLAQQAFVSAYQGLGGFQAGTDFYAWLKSIAYNHLRAELERTNRRRRLEKEYLLDLSAGELQGRLSFFDHTSTSLTPEGWALFDAAVRWCAHDSK